MKNLNVASKIYKGSKNPIIEGLNNASLIKEAKASISLDGETQCFPIQTQQVTDKPNRVLKPSSEVSQKTAENTHKNKSEREKNIPKITSSSLGKQQVQTGSCGNITKPFCLEDKRKDVDYETDNYVWCYPEEDVKQFIQELKKTLHFTDEEIEFINKLAGKSLT